MKIVEQIKPDRIAFAVLKKHGVEDLDGFKQAAQKAEDLRKHLDEPATQQKIRDIHILGATSKAIQEIFVEKVIALGFENEKIGLYTHYAVAGLRPDYYCNLGETGILLEVVDRF